MPAISKIRLTNVIYEQGQKRYHDELFLFDGFNGAVILENGGGKSVFVQTVLQAIIPHTDVGERKVKDTFILDEGPAHIAIEWLLNEAPRRYAVTAVTLFKKLNGIDSLRYVYEYGENDPHSIEEIPFVQKDGSEKRPSDRGKMSDYYSYMATQYSRNAKTFSQSIKSYREYIEKEFHIIAGEWEDIARINGAEGDIEAFFDNCKKTNELIDRLLIPSVEKGIAGYNKEVFADMFENRRNHFKKYKELKEMIDQNKLLSEELNAYVDHFRKVDEKEKLYLTARRNAKGYQTYLSQEIKMLNSKLEQLEEAFKEWREQQLILTMKNDSLTIQNERQLLKELVEKEKETQKRLGELNDSLQTCNHEYYSLQFAGAREDIFKEQGNIELFEQELQKLDRQDEVEDLTVDLERVNGQIHYLFLELKESTEKQIHSLTIEKSKLHDEKVALEEKQQHVQSELKNYQNREIEAKAEVGYTTKQMQHLKSQLVSHEDESVEQLLTIWTEKLQKLDEEKVSLDQQIKLLTPKIQQQKDYKNQLSEQLLEKRLTLSELEVKKSQLDEQHERILKQLAKTLPQWSYIDNAYNRHASIENQIKERLSHLKRKKEDVLVGERRAKRYVDDYIEQEQFFADPHVEKQFQQWNQFDYLVTGIQYIQSIDSEIAIENIQYPFWSLTLITTEKEKNDLIEKLKSIQHNLSYPIFVLSSNEAVQLVKGEKIYEEVVEPSIWPTNQDNKRFTQWKEQILQEAEHKTLERMKVEQSIQIWERTEEHFQQFIKDYPLEKYLAFDRAIQDVSHEVQNVQENFNKLEVYIAELERVSDMKQEKLRTTEISMQDLQDRLIPKAIEYNSFNKNLIQLQKQIVIYEQQIRKIMEQENNLRVNISRIGNDHFSKQNEINSLKAKLLYQVEQNELFKEVKQFRIIQTDLLMDVLKMKRNELINQINQIQTSRSEWMNRIESSRQRIEDFEKIQRRLKNDYGSINENYFFPINGEEKIAQLSSQLMKLKNEVQEALVLANKASTKKSVQEDRVNREMEQYNEKYPEKEVVYFTEELVVVEEQLQQEERILQKRLDYLNQQKSLQEKEQSICLELKQYFERYELVHKLEDPNLEGVMLTEQEKQEFPYKRKEVVERFIRELSKKQTELNDESEVLARAKGNFKRFCNNLTDPKLRKNAMEGVEIKRTYDEVLHYQQQLNERIIRTIQLAEVTIQDYDKEQQQFITYIHSHVRKVREDLLDIEKKTKVRVGNELKTIYQIQVPDWDENEAKEKIRDHIDWILSQIEKEAFKNDDGQEDSAKVRQFLEKTLQTVPLLREVIGNQTMKVKCRKVESDQHISSNYYTWEQSNKWSGGEKWSKNMALFLGLLNFIAEKSQHLQSNAKRHRTVLLDNPFGKASSDHVLSPVFFIAEQLGFQMIALTAHAEGKFLGDYFPILYSCKLRHLEGGTKQVLTKEKHIQTAYFQDHAPESLERLGEKEQMTLFE